ncbi:MAG TPA: MetQ/NlpA family ABC transporter substrate-binding protein [Syntrophomonas sp.]|nr:MetQ/NlpA family ABC transporter substrate-binding protein [Syntrophomonas sp.]HRW12626.1 MetQ/NlpA family ABC transporter substrate-binding protein [Syntrophomonas sp.]
MRKLLTILLVMFFTAGLAGCGETGNNAAEMGEHKTITIGVMPDVESIPFIIAEKNGYFSKADVQVKIEHFTSAKDRDSALQTGRLDGVITDVLAVVFANEGGIDLKMIARSEGNILLMAGREAIIASLDDLPGKSVGLSTNTIMEYTVDKMLATEQIKAEEINKIAIPPLPTRLEMLQGGKIDAAILPEPLAGLALKDGAVVLSSTDQMHHKAGAIAFTGKSLKENPDEIKAIFAAYNEAVDYLQKQPRESDVEFIIQEQGFPSAIKDSFTLPHYTHAEALDARIVAEVVQWMLSKNLIKQSYAYEDLTAEDILR